MGLSLLDNLMTRQFCISGLCGQNCVAFKMVRTNLDEQLDRLLGL